MASPMPAFLLSSTASTFSVLVQFTAGVLRCPCLHGLQFLLHLLDLGLLGQCLLLADSLATQEGEFAEIHHHEVAVVVGRGRRATLHERINAALPLDPLLNPSLPTNSLSKTCVAEPLRAGMRRVDCGTGKPENQRLQSVLRKMLFSLKRPALQWSAAKAGQAPAPRRANHVHEVNCDFIIATKPVLASPTAMSFQELLGMFTMFTMTLLCKKAMLV